MTLYETTLVIDSQLDENATEEKIKHYIDLLVQNGAEIAAVDRRKVRKMAYDIKGKDGTWRSQADYTFILYHAPGDAVAPVEALMKLDEDVLRFMTVKPRVEPDVSTYGTSSDSDSDSFSDRRNRRDDDNDSSRTDADQDDDSDDDSDLEEDNATDSDTDEDEE